MMTEKSIFGEVWHLFEIFSIAHVQKWKSVRVCGGGC